jgi:hypothetical protein
LYALYAQENKRRPFMAETNLSEIMELKEKSLAELKAKYEELFHGQMWQEPLKASA